MKRHILAGLALGATLAFQARADLISNGGFENPPFDSGTYAYRNNAQLTDWTVNSTHNGVVQFNSGYKPVDAGTYSVQIESGIMGNLPGDSMSQPFATTAGNTYRLTFDLSAYDSGGGVVGVNVGNLNTIVNGTDAAWVPQSFDFQATGPVSTLTFQNLGVYGVSYPHIDNVAVNEVTAPDGGVTGMLLGMGMLAISALRRKLS